tara:strand:- start:43 stop:477 length:435 start_codon:yes stop_codon:yes gene_type:complete
MKKITLILITLITATYSYSKDKYIALECQDRAISSFNVILNKETMAWDAYEVGKDASDLSSGTYQEVGEHYYHLDGTSEYVDLYLDRRTLFLIPPPYYNCLQDQNCSSSGKLESYEAEPCKIIDLPEEYLNNKSDLKTDQQNQI